MATPPATLPTRERHALGLRGARLDVEEIPKLAAEWVALDKAERVSWSLNWDQEMGTVEHLVLAAHRGELDADHQQELDNLVRRLEELVPMIEAMGLWMPQLRDPAAIRRRGHRHSRSAPRWSNEQHCR